jgi:hypothetical protein
MAFEILFTGSVPIQPADSVFETLNRHCGPFLKRIPDGEQVDWVIAAINVMAASPGLQVRETGIVLSTADTPFGGMQLPALSLRRGPQDVHIERFGYADAIRQAYRQLADLKQRRVIPAQVRLQATLPAPGTAGGTIMADWGDVLSIVQPPLAAEVDGFSEAVPAAELAVQFDLPVETGLEEWRRNPGRFGTPIYGELDKAWPSADLEALMRPVAELASRVPAEAELGFHVCSIWHMDPRGGQDLNVQVDAANLLAKLVGRRIDYIHLPVIPEHQPEDYAKLARLRLEPETKVFLGLIHGSDGLAGARQRVRMASQVLSDFGVAHFCGMRPLNQVDPAHLDDLLMLHRMVAELEEL